LSEIEKKTTRPTQTHQQPAVTGQEYKVRIQGKTHIKATKMNMTICKYTNELRPVVTGTGKKTQEKDC
jgi:hypothetical protein